MSPATFVCFHEKVFLSAIKERKNENKHPAESWSTWGVTLTTLQNNAGVDLSSVRVLSKRKAHVRYIVTAKQMGTFDPTLNPVFHSSGPVWENMSSKRLKHPGPLGPECTFDISRFSFIYWSVAICRAKNWFKKKHTHTVKQQYSTR